MFTQTRGLLESAVAVLLLLTTAGQSASLSDDLQTTTSPAPGNFTLTTQLSNGSMEEPLILRSHRPCHKNNEDFCKNGGECMYPQDSDEPSCICPAQYSGPRCIFLQHSVKNGHTLPELEHLIPICFGVAMFVFALAIIIYCCAYKRCVKSAPVKKPAPV